MFSLTFNSIPRRLRRWFLILIPLPAITIGLMAWIDHSDRFTILDQDGLDATLLGSFGPLLRGDFERGAANAFTHWSPTPVWGRPYTENELLNRIRPAHPDVRTLLYSDDYFDLIVGLFWSEKSETCFIYGVFDAEDGYGNVQSISSLHRSGDPSKEIVFQKDYEFNQRAATFLIYSHSTGEYFETFDQDRMRDLCRAGTLSVPLSSDTSVPDPEITEFAFEAVITGRGNREANIVIGFDRGTGKWRFFDREFHHRVTDEWLFQDLKE